MPEVRPIVGLTKMRLNYARLTCETVTNVVCVPVTTSLIMNADTREEDNGGGKIRSHALNMLCQMNPSQALAVRAKCVSKYSRAFPVIFMYIILVVNLKYY